MAWLQVLSGLDRVGWHQPLPLIIQELFLHDGLVVFPEAGELLFRGAWMHFLTLRAILSEAEKRVMAGEFNSFIEKDLPDVLTWLATDDPELDGNQHKAGWKLLWKQTTQWRHEAQVREGAILKCWRSPINRMSLRNFEIECILDAWSLIRHALNQRLCADRFLEGCLQGQERILIIRNDAGKTQATLRLSRVQSDWVVSDLRGFANSAVSGEIDALGPVIARSYTRDWNQLEG